MMLLRPIEFFLFGLVIVGALVALMVTLIEKRG